MVNSHRIGRLGMLAVGLGAGAAVAAAPGIASADPLDLATPGQTVADALVGSAGATTDGAAFDPNNYAISIDGITLAHEGTATATSEIGGIAFADGADSSAAADGFLSIATAGGAGSSASATGAVELAGATGDGSSADATAGAVDAAFANGAGATADAGGTNADPGYVDAAFANGVDSSALAGFFGTDPTGGSVDLASATDGATALANAGPFDVVFEPAPAAAAADLFGEGLTGLFSGADWSSLLSLF